MIPAGLPAPSSEVPATYGFGLPALALRDANGDDALLLRLADAAQEGAVSRPARVSAALGAAYEGPEEAGVFDPDRLSVIDRAAALFTLAHKIGRWPAEFVARCEACDEVSLLRVSPGEYAYTPAQAYRVERGGARYMQPNGHHEAMLATGAAPTEERLRIGPPPARKVPVEKILEALGRVAPAFDTALPFGCASCGAAESFWFDPLDWISRHGGEALAQVHRLALAYGWSEPEILAMPRARRRAYLQLIEAEP